MARTRILSDLHLGHDSSLISDVRQLAPLLDGIDELVLAGDSWQERFKGAKRRPAEEKRAAFEELVREREIMLTYLRGNHDPQTGAGFCYLAEGQVLVTHGDAVYRTATPWGREMANFEDEVTAIVNRYEPRRQEIEACVARAREIALTLKPKPLPALPPPLNFLSTALWPPSRFYHMFRVWRRLGTDLLDFLEESGGGAKVLVCGHFHRPGVWLRNGYAAVNTGAYMPASKPLAVDVVGKTLTVSSIKRSNNLFIIEATKEIISWD